MNDPPSIRDDARLGVREIPRVSPDAAEERLAIHRRDRVPLIIEGLHDEAKVSGYAEGESLASGLSESTVLLARNFYDQNYSESRSIPTPWPGADYLDALRSGRHGGHYVAISAAPPPISNDFEDAIAGLCRSEIQRRLFFLADEGYEAPMHLDGDFRETLFVQIRGRKRWALVEPIRSPELLPYRNYSTIRFHELASRTRERLLEQRCAWIGDLAAGDTMYMPASMWHSVQNAGISAGLAFRFGQTPLGRLLWLLPEHFTTHVLFDLLLRHEIDDERRLYAAREVLATYLGEHRSPRRRRRATLDRIRAHCLALDPDVELDEIQNDHFSVGERKDRYDAGRERRFWDPEVHPRMAPASPATPFQLERIAGLAATTGACPIRIAKAHGFAFDTPTLCQLEAQIIISQMLSRG